MTFTEFMDASPEDRQALRERNPAVYRSYFQIQILRPLAAQASPGPWYRSHGCVTASNPKGTQKPYWDRFLFNLEREKGLHGTEADARWICAANPNNIGSILDLLEALAAENEQLRAKT